MGALFAVLERIAATTTPDSELPGICHEMILALADR
jgi:hypothetical protein